MRPKFKLNAVMLVCGLAVTLAEMLLANAEEYVALSLGVAHKRIEAVSKGNWRKVEPQVFTLAGITKIRGLVYDRKGNDVILVGQRDPKRPMLTLDDFAVALRARFVNNQWPLVSIDPTPDSKKTNMQLVRYEGGIKDTQFGLDMFDADLRLKKIAMGLLQSGVVGIKSTWDMNIERFKRGGGHIQEETEARFWFYPISPSVTVREDVVVIEGLQVAVFTEVLSASIDGQPVKDVTTFVDPIGDEFAKQVSARYSEVAAAHAAVARLVGLNELVALSRAIEEMNPKPNLDCWLTKYKASDQPTPKTQETLRRRWKSSRFFHETAGGVHLTTIALRLQAGDVTALREAVLATRPDATELTWTFTTSQWLVPASDEQKATAADLASLFAHAAFLRQQRRFDGAIALYNRVVTLNAKCSEAFNDRGCVYDKKGEFDRAIADFDKAIAINPSDAIPYNNRGATYADGKRDYDRAIADYDKAVELNPNYAEAYDNRGIAYAKGHLDYERAIVNFDRAIALNPNKAAAYTNRGVAYHCQRNYDRAMADFDRAIEMDPNDSMSYFNRGVIYDKVREDYDHALADYDKAITLNRDFPEAYNNRGLLYAKGMQDYNRAIADFDKAIALRPKCAEAYYNKGLVCEVAKRKRQAIAAYRKCIELAPSQDEPYVQRAWEKIRK